MKVSAVHCHECKEVVYSRHRHDARQCSCLGDDALASGVMIDGGRDYTKLIYKNLETFLLKEIEIDATTYILEEDWKNCADKYGVIKL
jgi:hypothetical protein